LVLTVPKRLAKIARIGMIELAEFRYIQVWHPRMDPAHQWLRRMFAEAAVAE